MAARKEKCRDFVGVLKAFGNRGLGASRKFASPILLFTAFAVILGVQSRFQHKLLRI